VITCRRYANLAQIQSIIWGVRLPVRHNSSLPTKLRALALVDQGSQSLRDASSALKIPKSTLHDNLPAYRLDVARYLEWNDQADYTLVKNILIQSFDGKTSSRACATTLSKIMNFDISHQKVLKVLDLAGDTAEKLNNTTLCLAGISCAAFDEIFQRQRPILGFVDPISGAIVIKDSDDRSGAAWSIFLESLKVLGLEPKSTVTDGGSGLLSGIRQVFSDSTQVRDLFHVLNKLSKAKRIIEGKCYALIAAEERLLRSGDAAAIVEMSARLSEAIAIFDLLEITLRKFNRACYMGHDGPCYISSLELDSIGCDCIKLLEQSRQKIGDHRVIKEAMTYLKSGAKAIAAYKDMIETAVRKFFGPINDQMVLGFICPIIECLDQYQRAHYSRENQRFWGEKIAKLRASLRLYAWIDQGEVDAAIDAVSTMMTQFKKSSSLIETVNSVIRCHLQTYKSIPRWFCSIFTHFWNHRKFARGKRAGKSPAEFISGRREDADWVDLILERFPFDRLNKEMTLENLVEVEDTAA